MATLNTYLNFNGNTEEVFNFYKSVFGGEFVALMRFKDTPGCEGMTKEDQEGIMHVALPIGATSILMGTDIPSNMAQVKPGNNMSISINAESEAEADQLFNGLAEGGQVIMPLQKMFWNAYYGQLTDMFGIQWMVNYDYKQN